MATVSDKRTGTTLSPFTTMVEVPVYSEQERAEMLAALEEAEARIDAGEYFAYDSATYKDRLMAIYREARVTGRALPSACTPHSAIGMSLAACRAVVYFYSLRQMDARDPQRALVSMSPGAPISRQRPIVFCVNSGAEPQCA